jgi:hypothetical protein
MVMEATLPCTVLNLKVPLEAAHTSKPSHAAFTHDTDVFTVERPTQAVVPYKEKGVSLAES